MVSLLQEAEVRKKKIENVEQMLRLWLDICTYVWMVWHDITADCSDTVGGKVKGLPAYIGQRWTHTLLACSLETWILNNTDYADAWMSS